MLYYCGYIISAVKFSSQLTGNMTKHLLLLSHWRCRLPRRKPMRWEHLNGLKIFQIQSTPKFNQGGIFINYRPSQTISPNSCPFVTRTQQESNAHAFDSCCVSSPEQTSFRCCTCCIFRSGPGRGRYSCHHRRSCNCKLSPWRIVQRQSPGSYCMQRRRDYHRDLSGRKNPYCISSSH